MTTIITALIGFIALCLGKTSGFGPSGDRLVLAAVKGPTPSGSLTN